MKQFLIIFFLFIYSSGNAQISWDTTINLSRHEAGYGKFPPSVKASITYGDYMGFEIARVRNSLSLVWLMSNTATKYYALQWENNPGYRLGLFGFKAGGEVNFRYLHLGCGGVAKTDLEQIKYFLVPEFGITWWGTFGIYYGTILSLNNEDFIGTNNYQVGVKYDFTKDLFKEFKKGTL